MPGKPARRSGRRNGSGNPATNFHATVGFHTVTATDGTVTQVEENLIDRVERILGTGGFIRDAAASAGVSIDILREWQKVGVRACRDILGGVRRHSQLSKHEKQCAELAERMTRAEADARVGLLTLGFQLANGGYERRETVERVNAAGEVIDTTTRSSIAEPDKHMVQWLLKNRWADDFGRTTVEVTGPGGAPLLDGASIADRIREDISRAASNRAATDPEAMATNGQGNGHHP